MATTFIKSTSGQIYSAHYLLVKDIVVFGNGNNFTLKINSDGYNKKNKIISITNYTDNEIKIVNDNYTIQKLLESNSRIEIGIITEIDDWVFVEGGNGGLAGPSGRDGRDGAPGAPGPAGLDGAPGSKGDKGDTGNQGQQGIPGSPGVDGEQGPAGQQGIQGEQGAPGPAPIWGNITGSIANQTDISGAFSVVNVSINSKESKDNKGAASGYASLNSSGLVEQNPANATATPTPNKIAIADANGKLDGWITASGGGNGYTLNIGAASQSTTTDGQTIYWGSMFVAPSTTADRWRVYICKSGIIKSARIYSYAGTAGSNENWTMNIRKNNTTDTQVQTLAVATNNRVWANDALNISVVAGDYIEIKEVCPSWATNPATVTRAGWIYIE